jgi:hypothetical protein
MKIHRLSVSRILLSFLVVALSGLVWWAGTPARAASAPTIALIPVSGTVSGQPESVRFSGQARVSSELVLSISSTSRTRPLHLPAVILIIDLSSVSGTGSSSGAKYAAGGDGTPVIRQLASADTVEITFPFSRGASTAMSSVRTGVASFALNFDTNTGAITKGTATVAAPNFPN